MNTLKRIWRVVSTVLVAVAVLLAVALVGVRLVGFEVYTVLSGSMEPAYHTGSVIWVQECEPEEVEVGDPITFVMNEDLLVATHRVIEIDEANQHFYTKGDANEAPDAAPVHFENLIGKPVFTVPHLGYFVSYIQQPPGLYVAIAACAFLLLLMFLPELFAKDEGPVEKQPLESLELTLRPRAWRVPRPRTPDPDPHGQALRRATCSNRGMRALFRGMRLRSGRVQLEDQRLMRQPPRPTTPGSNNGPRVPANPADRLEVGRQTNHEKTDKPENL